MTLQEMTGGAQGVPPPKPTLSTYEISDPETGEKWEVETAGDFTDEDVQSVLRGIRERPSAKVDALQFSGRLSGASAKKAQPKTTTGGIPSLSEVVGKLGENKEVKRWLDSSLKALSVPLRISTEGTDILAQAGGDLLTGRPLMGLEGNSAGERLRDMSLGMVPYLSEGRAGFTGTQRNPQGGFPAAWEVLGDNWQNDPVGVILQGLALKGIVKAPSLKSLNEGMKALQTSGDLSAPGRQGALLSINNPKRVGPALKDMVEAVKSPAGLEAVAARAGRPMVGGTPVAPAPTLASMVTVQPGPIPTGGVPLAPVPSQTPRAASPVSRSAMTEIKPGIYRFPTEVLDEALQTRESVAGGLKRATQADMLPAVQGPESATITTQPLTGTFPDGTPRVKTLGAPPVAPVGPAPETFGLSVKPGQSELYRGKWAKEIPLIGPMVAASERGFDGYLVSIRRGAFDDAAANLAKKGITPESSPQTYKDLATWINRASGVGTTPIPSVIADAMFAPRLTASRLELLNPREYQKLDAPVRKLAIKQVLTATGAGLSVLALAKASGQSVSLDPDSPDFGKVLLRDGKTRYEVFAGMTPYARLAAMALIGKDDKYDSSWPTKKLRSQGEKVGGLVGKRVESMLGPLPSLALSAFRGSTFTGEEFDPLSETGKRFTPLVASDMADAIRELGGVEGILKASPALGGVGVQVYESKKKARPSRGIERF